MRTLKSILVLGLALSTFTAAEAAKLTFKVTNPNEKVKVILTFSQSGEQKEVAIDAAGNGNIEITGFTPQYVTMQYTRGRRTLYLDPNQDLTLSFDSDNMWRNTTFEGAGAAINTYLGSKELRSLGMPDMKMQEAALIHKGDSLYAVNCQVLEAAKLPADFTAQEKIRLQFYTYYYFSKYALYHPHFGKDDNYIPSKAYYELNSTCKCNRILINNLFKFFVWREVSKSFTRSIIEFIFNPLNLFVGYFTKVLTLWDILPDKPVGVFIGTTFP